MPHEHLSRWLTLAIAVIIEQCELSTDEPKRISMRWVVKVDRAARASLETAKGFLPFELTVDGCEVPSDHVVTTKKSDTYVFELRDYVVPMVERVAVKPTEEPVVRDMVMVVLLARAVLGGRPSGWLGLL